MDKQIVLYIHNGNYSVVRRNKATAIATKKAEARGSLGVQSQPGQHSKTPSQNETKQNKKE
jgi:hypothetical protein